MSAGRNWYFFTVAIAALSLGLDAAAQKPGHLLQKSHDFKPAWAGPVFPGPQTGLVPGPSTRGSTQPSLPGTGQSTLKDPPGHGGAMPAKSNKGGGHGSAPGKDEPDAPGENVQVNAGDIIPQAKPMREIATCR